MSNAPQIISSVGVGLLPKAGGCIIDIAAAVNLAQCSSLKIVKAEDYHVEVLPDSICVNPSTPTRYPPGSFLPPPPAPRPYPDPRPGGNGGNGGNGGKGGDGGKGGNGYFGGNGGNGGNGGSGGNGGGIPHDGSDHQPNLPYPGHHDHDHDYPNDLWGPLTTAHSLSHR